VSLGAVPLRAAPLGAVPLKAVPQAMAVTPYEAAEERRRRLEGDPMQHRRKVQIQ
jgi:hypothetical protein